ncbi:substrate-binding periplasmic protein [Paucibacter soli]|uniref:substrate-binding periplasmic protein n=1 Tax=Paucibacter soli TaxID=3133433 RepID=UPI0030B58D59
MHDREARRSLMLGLAGAAALGWTGRPARAQPALQIVTEEAPPYNFSDGKDGRPTGMCTELVQEVLGLLQQTAEISVLPWARAYEMARQGENVLIYSIARTAQRESLFKWVGVLTQVEYGLYALASRGLRLGSLSEAMRWQIATVNADVGEQYLEANGFAKGRQLQSSARNQFNFEKLKMGRVDLWITTDLIAQQLASQAGDDGARLLAKALTLPELQVDYYMAFGPATADAQVERFRKALETLKKNGRHAAIRRKWFGST